ncbi:hypothetical protein AOL_s00110g250 [Orbilia oligospora ATCC 24927]|uniref:Uncharacterized protein n=2 Tax=Orbilia oligospora TaxID=2813651 RepID=G1XL80_ARTOA|nr:hypothetical protein AOL_s00110g250 [Orbilia oligospora ATCC 24927]EGX46086.1 hypothetical protein AOL_s00110g250 [Orbilia oligospora ATCC 24927]
MARGKPENSEIWIPWYDPELMRFGYRGASLGELTFIDRVLEGYDVEVLDYSSRIALTCILPDQASHVADNTLLCGIPNWDANVLASGGAPRSASIRIPVLVLHSV